MTVFPVSTKKTWGTIIPMPRTRTSSNRTRRPQDASNMDIPSRTRCQILDAAALRRFSSRWRRDLSSSSPTEGFECLLSRWDSLASLGSLAPYSSIDSGSSLSARLSPTFADCDSGLFRTRTKCEQFGHFTFVPEKSSGTRSLVPQLQIMRIAIATPQDPVFTVSERILWRQAGQCEIMIPSKTASSTHRSRTCRGPFP